MKRINGKFHCLAALLSLFCLSAGAFAASEAEEKFRATYFIEPNVVLQFRDEKGEVIDLEEFTRQTKAGKAFSIMKRKAAGDQGESKTFKLVRPMTEEERAKFVPRPKVQMAGKAVPAFQLRDVEGKPASQEDLIGRSTLINFYFAECLPCIKETPMLNELQSKRRDLQVLAITFDDSETIAKYIAKHKFVWRTLVGARPFIKEVGVDSFPHFLVVDAKGVIRATAGSAEIMLASGDKQRGELNPERLGEWVDGALAAPPAKQAAQ